MWDAWSAYDGHAQGVFVRERHTAANVDEARRAAISYAAYDVLYHRYAKAIGAPRTLACLRAVMSDLGYDPNDAHDTGDDPVAFGNRVGHQVIAARRPTTARTKRTTTTTRRAFASRTPHSSIDEPGAPLVRPEEWQPLNLAVAATQNGIVLPAGVQEYVGSQWGDVTPFAMKRTSRAVPWHDPGPAPKLDDAMKGYLVEVIRKTAEVDASDDTTIDISPGAYGHNSLGHNDGRVGRRTR